MSHQPSIPSPPPPRTLFLSDDDDDDAHSSPSEYSSCDDYHDFDRYCSANSAFLSPSSCASRGIDDIEIPHSPWIRGRHRSPYDCDDDDDDGIASSEGARSAIDGGEGGSGRRSEEKRAAGERPRRSPLLMNSSVAFGSGDWDEFLQETATACDLQSLSLFQEQSINRPIDSGPTENHAGKLLVHEVDEEEGKDCVLAGASRINGIDHSTNSVGKLLVHKVDEEEGKDCVLAGASHLNGIDYSTDGVGVCTVEDSSRDYGTLHVEMPVAELHLAVGHAVPSSGDRAREGLSQCIEDVPRVDVDGASLLWSAGASEDRLPLFQSETTLTSALRGEDSETREVEKSTTGFLLNLNDGEDATVGGSVNMIRQLGDLEEDRFVPDEVRKPDTGESFDDMVLEMEEILLDSGKSPGCKSNQGNRGLSALQSCHLRDGSSTASTSGTDDAYILPKHPPKVDWVEVVGAKQKKGDVSFGDRLVGVKEYTVYKIRVWSGKEQWEVERRYRDFFSLYRQLRNLFADHGLSLPYPWPNVERESRKIFGNASPSVVKERSAIIQDCLRSVLNTRNPSSAASSLACFLFPGEVVHQSSFITALIPRSLQKFENKNSGSLYFGEISQEGVSTFGKTISLILELRPYKSMRQLLEEQHYTCAGCHRHLGAGRTLLREFVQTFGWNKPRFCEYTGQLFCASCHTNETSVLPAKVLHLWDFSLCPVSQLAKAYLDSIFDQPMLCVSAVNPFLFSKVPALLHVMGVRKKIGAMIPYLQCPFRTSIQRGLGFRRYLLEANDFFALRDLFDLSKGAFAALPNMVETISSKIFEHITQQCLVCYDAGVPCAARQACNEPSSLIFPFQEDEATRCTSCGSIFHTPCFGKLMGCPCGKPGGADRTAGPSQLVVNRKGEEPSCVDCGSFQSHDSVSTSGFFSDLLPKAMADRIWKPKKGNPVILMGSLPSTSL